MFVNGKPAARCADWTKPVMERATTLVRKGRNELLVAAANGSAGGPAALLLELHARLADGSTRVIASDGAWEWTAAVPNAKGQFKKGAEPTDWKPAVVVTPQGTWDACISAAFQVGWILHVSSVTGLSNSPSWSST